MGADEGREAPAVLVAGLVTHRQVRKEEREGDRSPFKKVSEEARRLGGLRFSQTRELPVMDRARARLQESLGALRTDDHLQRGPVRLPLEEEGDTSRPDARHAPDPPAAEDRFGRGNEGGRAAGRNVHREGQSMRPRAAAISRPPNRAR